MALLRKTTYDRRKLLDQARAAQGRGRLKKAIRLYQRVLEAEPQDHEIHRKLAPLLARTRQREAALASFGEAVSGLMKRGMEDKALGVCHETVRFYPQRIDVWEAIARLELERKRTSDALRALLTGRSHCRGRRHRGDALRLLRRAHEIAPDDVPIAADLARQLARSGARFEARNLLAGLARRVVPRQRRRVRWAQLRLDPTPANLWAWLVGR